MHLVLGHIGHWWTSGLYLAPVVIVAVALAVSERRARRREGDDGRCAQDGARAGDAHQAG
ncbi:MAG TPA: hypothetical protein VGP78_03175 [Solirubrobacteraceae bacterium]|jgi:hypothetical protein|nr:hypothetical protein [Solirubrobacteraceae bacterium]